MAFDRDKIVQFVKMRGPLLPAQIKKETGTDIMFASAILSELVDKNILKLSHLKIGGSPLYYAPGQEYRLQPFSDKLNEKDRKTYELLKKEIMLRDYSLDPLTRVSLRQIKDFAVPLEVTIDGNKEIFWKWYLTPAAEIQERIRTALGIPPVQQKPPESQLHLSPQQNSAQQSAQSLPQQQHFQHQHSQIPLPSTLQYQSVQQQQQPIVQQQNFQQRPLQQPQQASSSSQQHQQSYQPPSQQQRISPVVQPPVSVQSLSSQAQQSLQQTSVQREQQREQSLFASSQSHAIDKEEPEKSKRISRGIDKIDKEIGKEEAKKKQEREKESLLAIEKQKESQRTLEGRQEDPKDKFFRRVKRYFDQNKIVIKTFKIKRKEADIEFVVEVPSSVGNLVYYCKAKDKKKVNDGDLSSLFIDAQRKKMPVLYLVTGDLTKKAQQLLETEFSSMSVKKV